ncbi:MAG: hypothetical protein ACRDJ3_12250, partial [Solirubrobacteraceae bacterium]
LPTIGPGIEAHELFPNRTNVSWYTEVDTQPTAGEAPTGHPGTGKTDAGGPTNRPAETEPGGNMRDAEAYGRIRARIFERGVGETLSSGTGATGAALAYHLAGGPSRVRVLLDGGELDVEVGDDLQVNLTGWARPVFAGHLSEDFLRELHDTTTD